MSEHSLITIDLLRQFNSQKEGAFLSLGNYLFSKDIPEHVQKEIDQYSDYLFVIPNETSYECTRCAECCKLYSIGNTITKGCVCPDLKDKSCSRYSTRYTGCKTYPFHIITLNTLDVLMIHSRCKGLGKGALFRKKEIRNILKELNQHFAEIDGVDLKLGYTKDI